MKIALIGAGNIGRALIRDVLDAEKEARTLAVDFDETSLKTRLHDHECLIRVEIKGDGKGETRFWTCDLTEDYVKINASYRT